MPTTQDDIRRWLKSAKKQKATHLVVVCDTFDWDDYPVYVKPTEKIREVIEHYSVNMQKVMEVYNMSMDIEKQIKSGRAYNI